MCLKCGEVSYRARQIDLWTQTITTNTKRLLRSNNSFKTLPWMSPRKFKFVNAARVTLHTKWSQERRHSDSLHGNGSKALVGKAGIFLVSDGTHPNIMWLLRSL